MAVLFWQSMAVLDFGHNEADNLTSINGRDRIKLLSGGYIRVPRVGVFNGKPFATKSFHFREITRIQKSENGKKSNMIIDFKLGREISDKKEPR